MSQPKFVKHPAPPAALHTLDTKALHPRPPPPAAPPSPLSRTLHPHPPPRTAPPTQPSRAARLPAERNALRLRPNGRHRAHADRSPSSLLADPAVPLLNHTHLKQADAYL